MLDLNNKKRAARRIGLAATAAAVVALPAFIGGFATHGVTVVPPARADSATTTSAPMVQMVPASFADLVVPAPSGMTEGQAAVLSLLPIQVMAFETAMRRGRNPDAPVNLSKVVIFPT